MTGTLAIIRGMSPPHRPETETSRAEAERDPGTFEQRQVVARVNKQPVAFFDAALAQIRCKAGRRLAVRFLERRITVDVGMEALADDHLPRARVQPRTEISSLGALHTMIRPHKLWNSV